MAVKRPVCNYSGKLKELQTGDTLPGGGGGSFTLTPFTKDLGIGQSGVFDLTGLSGLTPNNPILVMQTAAPIASKGDARDEPEMDTIRTTGYAFDATTLRVFWNATGVVVGTYAFAYGE